MDRPWFRVERFGYGAGLPCSWQGWVVLAAHLSLILGAAAILSGRPVLLSIVVITSTLGVVWVAWKKSDAPWRWRNGED